MILNAVFFVLSSNASIPTLSFVFFNIWCINSRMIELLPIPAPDVNVINSPVRIPYVLSFSFCQGYRHVSQYSSSNKEVFKSFRLTIPAGVYGCAFHHALENSSRLFILRYSFASLCSMCMTLHLLGAKSCATFSAASLPCLSISNDITI